MEYSYEEEVDISVEDGEFFAKKFEGDFADTLVDFNIEEEINNEQQ